MRSRETIKSILEGIPGIGRVRQRDLLKHFGSVEKIKEASLEALAKAPQMNEKLARAVYLFFHREEA
jgi:excinuclease ABC subunit C